MGAVLLATLLRINLHTTNGTFKVYNLLSFDTYIFHESIIMIKIINISITADVFLMFLPTTSLVRYLLTLVQTTADLLDVTIN